MSHIVEYIEEHANDPLTVDDLAKVAGYSLHHFCHAFASHTGIPAATYLRRRHLDLAADAILAGATTTEAAAMWGFDTASGFAKAFRKHYGMSPTEYKKLYKGEVIATPTFKSMDAFSAIGYHLSPPEGDFDILDHGAYWHNQDFSSIDPEEYNKLTYPGFAEISAWVRPTEKNPMPFYFVGIIVKDKSFVPKGAVVIDAPAANYAVFTVSAGNLLALNRNVKRMWQHIFFSWFGTSGYLYDENALAFEYYLGENAYLHVPILMPQAERSQSEPKNVM